MPIRAYYEMKENSLTAILIVGELYMPIIFVLIATAIPTMKMLAETDADRSRFDLLYKLGVDREEREKRSSARLLCIKKFHSV